MKALQLTEIGRLDVVELPDPEPKPGEVLIRISATGICGSDFHGYSGENGRRVPGQVMGHESVGTVAALGADASGFEVGQVVTFNPVVLPDDDVEAFAGREQMSPNKSVIGVDPKVVASFAQLIAVPARNVVALPATMPLEYGALIEPIAVAVHAVRRTTAGEGSRVAVIGGGPIGQSLVLALQMAGVTDIVVAELSQTRRELLAKLGVEVVDSSVEDLAAAAQRLWGAPADVAFDAVGITPTLKAALEATGLGGEVCLVGMGSPQVSLEAFAVSTQERTITGSFTYAAKDFADAAAWVGTAPEQLAALISEQVSMDEADAAFDKLARGGDVPGKILVRLDEEGQ